MSIWPVPDITIEPELSLNNWQVYETEAGERHLVGYCTERYEGRVSSAVTAFDPLRMCAVTRSGRTYSLCGAPGFSADGDYVWQGWKRINAVTAEKDITEQVWRDCELAQARSSGQVS